MLQRKKRAEESLTFISAYILLEYCNPKDFENPLKKENAENDGMRRTLDGPNLNTNIDVWLFSMKIYRLLPDFSVQTMQTCIFQYI
jgi:hypothetical protein